MSFSYVVVCELYSILLYLPVLYYPVLISISLLGGDISYACGYAAVWDFFLNMISPISSSVLYLTTVGNHESDFPLSGTSLFFNLLLQVSSPSSAIPPILFSGASYISHSHDKYDR